MGWGGLLVSGSGALGFIMGYCPKRTPKRHRETPGRPKGERSTTYTTAPSLSSFAEQPIDDRTGQTFSKKW
jgi:hypothetical protein